MKKTILLTAVCLGLSSQVNAKETKPFTMDGEFGLIVTTGNTETTSAKAKLSAHQELDKWSNDYIFEGLYKKDEVEQDGEKVSNTSAHEWFASGQGNYKLQNPDHRIFVFGSYEENRLSSFDYQSTVAVGWNQKVWETDSSKFEYSIGPGYSYAKTQEPDSETISGMIVRGAINYEWNISDTATFKQLLSTEVGSDNTKSKSETSVTAQLNGSLAMKFSIILDHNSDVAADKEKLDTQSAVTLVYTFF